MTTRTFTNSSTLSNWATPANWSGGVLPGPADVAANTQVFAGTAYIVGIGDSETVGSVLLDAANAQISISGLGTLNAGTFDLQSGLLSFTSRGVLQDAVLIADGGALFSQFGTFDGVTVHGSLEIAGDSNSPPQSLDIKTSFTLRDASGTGSGRLDVTAPNAFVRFDDSETIDGTGAPGDAGVLITLAADNDHLGANKGATLTLGAHATVRQTGAGSAALDGVGTIVNNGHIDFAGGGGFIDPADFINAGTIDISLGERAFMGGLQTTNNGLIAISGTSSLQLQSDLTGSGTITLAQSSTLEVGDVGPPPQGGDLSGTVVFTDATDLLILDVPGIFTGHIAGFAHDPATGHGDTIELLGETATSLDFSGNALGGTLVARDAGDHVLAQLDLVGHDYTHAQFSHVTDSSGDTLITTDAPPCFLAGTRILTEQGPRTVEELRTGDRVVTIQRGERILASITWIGQRRMDPARHPDPLLVLPIQIRRDAFADGVPRRDVYLSPDHAIFVDGLLMPARQLVNGSSIVQVTALKPVHYLHVEMPSHTLLVAEGLPVESYLDTGNRGIFENAGGPLVLHPDLATALAQQRRWTASCAPFASDAARVEPAWRRLARRALLLGYAAADSATTRDPVLRVIMNGQTLLPVSVDSGRYSFRLPVHSGNARLVSRRARPCDTRPWLEDRRRLGVMVTGIALHRGGTITCIAMNDASLDEGWWEVERDGASMWRWTTGNAVLPITRGPALLEVTVGYTVAYPSELPDHLDAA